MSPTASSTAARLASAVRDVGGERGDLDARSLAARATGSSFSSSRSTTTTRAPCAARLTRTGPAETARSDDERGPAREPQPVRHVTSVVAQFSHHESRFPLR